MNKIKDNKVNDGWLKYYLPLRWTFATRYINVINVINVISFFLIDAFPSFFIVMLLGDVNFQTAFSWFIAFFTMFCFYECGYIFNETISVRYEKNPTLRIPEPYFSQMPKHLENILTIRIIIGVLGSWYLLSIYPANWQIYILQVLLLLLVYSVHNFFRGKINILTMAMEVSLKYMIPISIFLPFYQLNIALSAIILTIVLVRLIEYISKKKFVKGICVTQDVDVFRVRYYLIIGGVGIFLSFTGIWPSYLFCLPLFFLVYRLSSWYAMKHLKGVAGIIHTGRQHHGTDGSNEEKKK